MAKTSFTKKYSDLEKIVKDFESREIDLDKDIPAFEKGLKLAKELKGDLEKLENKVKKITLDNGG